MNRDDTHFQYNQKMVLLSKDKQSVLLAKRQGEQDYNATFSFTGGKLEVTDDDFIDGLRREKDEELGANCKVKICPAVSWNVLFRKADGNTVIVAHFPAQYLGGEIELSDEYSEYQWVEISKLESFEPKVHNIPELVQRALETEAILKESVWLDI